VRKKLFGAVLVLCLLASLLVVGFIAATPAKATDKSPVSANSHVRNQEPTAMLLVGVSLLGFAFVARQWSRSSRPVN
jgi:hypothetical protein